MTPPTPGSGWRFVEKCLWLEGHATWGIIGSTHENLVGDGCHTGGCSGFGQGSLAAVHSSYVGRLKPGKLSGSLYFSASTQISFPLGLVLALPLWSPWSVSLSAQLLLLMVVLP